MCVYAAMRKICENPRDEAVIQGNGIFFNTKKKSFFRYGLGYCVCTKFHVYFVFFVR